MLHNLSWLDMAALALIVFMGVFGAIKGAVRTVVSLAAGLVGVVAASRFGAAVGVGSWPGVRTLEDPETFGVGVGCTVVFLAVLLAGVFLGRLLRKLIVHAELGTLDRILGVVVGVAKGALTAALLGLATLAFQFEPLAEDARTSITMEHTRELFEANRETLPPRVALWLEQTLQAEPGDQRGDGSR